MKNQNCARAVVGIAAALIFSAGAVPVLADTVSMHSESFISAGTSDVTFAGGLDLEAEIIAVVEQDQNSLYARTGIANVEEYVNIYEEADAGSELVGKLYAGCGCEIMEIRGGWAHIVSGECEGFVEACTLVTGVDAEIYADENEVSEIVATSDGEETVYIYENDSEESDIIASIDAEDELPFEGFSDDNLWVRVRYEDTDGYIPADAVTLSIRYEEAVSVEEELAAIEAAEEEARAEAAERAAAETAAASVEEVNETVWATKTVMIRSLASVDSEVLGKLPGGCSITRTGKLDNGWSRVSFNDSTAYINSDYLTAAEPVTEKAVEETVYTTAGVNVRAGSSTDSDVVTTLAAGTGVTRTGIIGDWSRVVYGDVTGYIRNTYLSTSKPEIPSPEESRTSSESTPDKSSGSSAADSSPAVEEVNETVYTTAGVNVRSEASASSSRLGSVGSGTSLTRTGKLDNGWSRVEYDGKTGYISSKYLSTTKPSSSSSSSSNSSLGQQIADYAVLFLGYPYVYGGNDLYTGVDCSGFTQQVYKHFGISIPRTSSEQACAGSAVSISDVQPGDLLFYSSSSTGKTVSHVGIYIGNGKIVHASTSKTGIIKSDMYYKNPICARRFI